MNKLIIIFILTMTINSCLELKYIEKTEYFNIDCDGILIKTIIERSKNECNAG